MLKKTAIFFLFFLGAINARTQTAVDSCTMEISLLTCSPGTDLYSIFGHTAIRIQDRRRGMDVVYNYGTFDDSDPLFYVNFTNGIMRYSLSAQTFDSFMVEYQEEHRSVKAQILNLNCAEKIRLYEALRKNTLDENRFYDYHFHTDNCTTRAGRMIEANSDSLRYSNTIPTPPPSFRDMIHESLDRQHADWSAFGIDMMLGRNIDDKASNLEAVHFLPDYLFRGLEGAKANGKPVVAETKTLLEFNDINEFSVGLSPFRLFLLFLIISILLFIFRAHPIAAKSLLIFDIVFFTFLGLVGLLISYAWIFRVDNVCRDNINIFWAIPTHIIAVFFIRKKIPWVKYYFLITGLIALVLLIGFAWWPERMNVGVLPILAIIIFRCSILYQNRSHGEKVTVQR